MNNFVSKILVKAFGPKKTEQKKEEDVKTEKSEKEEDEDSD